MILQTSRVNLLFGYVCTTSHLSIYNFQDSYPTSMCNLPSIPVQLKTRDVLLSEQPIQHTFNTLLSDTYYTVSVAAINNVGIGHPDATFRRTTEEGHVHYLVINCHYYLSVYVHNLFFYLCQTLCKT